MNAPRSKTFSLNADDSDVIVEEVHHTHSTIHLQQSSHRMTEAYLTSHMPSSVDHHVRRRSSHEFKSGLLGNATLQTLPVDVDMPTSTIKKHPSFSSMGLRRRGSLDVFHEPRKFLIDVDETQRRILAQEDTDGDFKITVNDKGPKVFTLGTMGSGGQRKIEVRGTYMLSNLLQELALARDIGLKQITIDESRLSENPVNRLSRMIRDYFWDGLLRRVDEEGLPLVMKDAKNPRGDATPHVYVPHHDDAAYRYFQTVAQHYAKSFSLQVIRLPSILTADYVQSLNTQPGILSLKLTPHSVTHKDGTTEWRQRGTPFVVPGGRFNEMYGWDSYFETLGLLCDQRLDLAQSMVENFVYQIEHYGKILNANRTYYLLRSQPPFLTDMALHVYRRMASLTAPSLSHREQHLEWLRKALLAAIQEYRQVWMSPPRYVPEVGLSRYFAEGRGMPPETETSHFDAIIAPFALKWGLDKRTFADRYNAGEIHEPELDEYFMHDRAVRESGHDTTYRFERKCAYLCTIDLNALLYKYETDIAFAIDEYFQGCLQWTEPSHFTTTVGGESITVREYANEWRARASKRRDLIDRYLWNEREGMYFDYHIREKRQMDYESATTFFPLWAKLASVDQARRLVEEALPRFEKAGGLVSGTERSRGTMSLSRPNRQWDYPYGWAPHQILAWQGLVNYGYPEVAQRLAYKWLSIIMKSVVDFNGTVPEKYDVVECTHRVFVEYGNVGTDFSYITREGFGWMNASFQVGLHYMTPQQRRALGALTPYDVLFRRKSSEDSQAAAAWLSSLDIKDTAVRDDLQSPPADMLLFPSSAAMALVPIASPPAPVSVMKRRSSVATVSRRCSSMRGLGSPRGSMLSLLAEQQSLAVPRREWLLPSNGTEREEENEREQEEQEGQLHVRNSG